VDKLWVDFPESFHRWEKALRTESTPNPVGGGQVIPHIFWSGEFVHNIHRLYYYYESHILLINMLESKG